MSANTAIEWCDHTFNPWIGCTRVGPGCDHCYAEADFDKRRHVVTWGAGQKRHATSATTWAQPYRWNRNAEAFQAQHGRRQRVFCASLADVFDNEVPEHWRRDLLGLIAETPHLDWLLLTKRIGNARAMLNEAIAGGWDTSPWPNVWIGATVVNQAEADRDIPKLLNVPAARRFLSVEPMLGPISFEGFYACPANQADGSNALEYLDWIICGGESGPKARPMHPDWPRSLRDQCEAAGVPFLFKQWGEWQIASEENGHFDADMARNLAHWVAIDGSTHKPSSTGLDNPWAMVKVGKKAAGRVLDGRTHDDYPTSTGA